MRVIEAGDGSCFAFEALGEAALAYLDGNGSVQPSVAGFVDFAHATCAKRGDDFVRPQTRFCCDGHIAGNDTAGFGGIAIRPRSRNYFRAEVRRGRLCG